MPQRDRYEVVVVGAGIAGASLAYFLTQRGITDVLVLEREAQPGYHATGRSAAVLVEVDLIATVRQLTILGAEFLRRPPVGFAENPLVDESGVLLVFAEPMWSAVQQLAPMMESEGLGLELLSTADAIDRIPDLDPAYFDGGLYLPEGGHIDVHGLLTGYLGHATKRGAELQCGVGVTGVRVERGRCVGVATDVGDIAARWVVDAAGAWVGESARLAGAAPIPFAPTRRTIITFDVARDVSRWPLVSNESHHLYFAPESGGLKASPMDEQPSPPCDARPDDIGVAQAIDKLERLAPSLAPRAIRSKWAGLRTFSPDREFVVGEDPLVKGFFWLAGQGGAGIETSPAVGRLAADLIATGSTALFDASKLSPSRF